MMRFLAALLAIALLSGAAHADALPAVLRRGINITNWFRFPPSRDPAALRGYLDDAAIAGLRRAGFTFVRLPVQPELLAAPGVSAVLAEAVARLERHGLAVVVTLHPGDWHLETDAGDRAKLVAFWRSAAPLLRRFDPAMTFPEVLNEPVFADSPGTWASLQHQVLLEIRAVLPVNTVILTGADWGSIAGLLALVPETDRNVVYSFHLYDPAELTALGAYRAGLGCRGDGAPAISVHRCCCLRGDGGDRQRCADRGTDALLLRATLGRCQTGGEDRDGGRLGTQQSHGGAGGRIRCHATVERAGAFGLVARGAGSLRTAVHRLGTVGL